MKLQYKPPILRNFVGWSEQSDPRQIAKKVTKIIFFQPK